jgi:hypothetical protein
MKTICFRCLFVICSIVFLLAVTGCISSDTAHLNVEVLSNVQDHTPLNDELVSEQGYQEVLDYLKNTKPQELKESGNHLDYNDYFTDPKKFRGEIMSLSGLIIQTDQIRLSKPVSADTNFIYRTFLVDPSGTEGYVIDLVKKPDNFTLRRDLVKTKGVFYKIVSYESRKGKVKEVPLFLGIQLESVRGDSGDSIPNSKK